MSSVAEDFTWTLFHVQPTISQFLLDEAETDYKAKAELKKIIRKNAEGARQTERRLGEGQLMEQHVCGEHEIQQERTAS